jgi:hypothetical protein
MLLDAGRLMIGAKGSSAKVYWIGRVIHPEARSTAVMHISLRTSFRLEDGRPGWAASRTRRCDTLSWPTLPRVSL